MPKDDILTFSAEIFEAGDYTDLGYSPYTEEDLALIAENTNKEIEAGIAKNEININHWKTTGTIDTGTFSGIKHIGKKMFANLNIPRGIYNNLRATDLSVEIDRHNHRLVGLAITTDGIVPSAKFSEDAIHTFSRSFSMSDLKEETEAVAEAIVEEKQEEVVEEPVVLVEAKEEALQDVVETTDAFSESEALKKRVQELEVSLQKMEDEKIEKSIEAYSTEKIAGGIPPIIVELLAPVIVKSTVERFSHMKDFSGIAAKIIEFFSDNKTFDKKLTETHTSGRTDGVYEIEEFSDEAIKSRIDAKCAKDGIQIGSEEYAKRLSVELAKKQVSMI